MRNGLKVLVAVAFAASVAACDAGNDELETFEAEEAATPSLETTQPGGETAIMTAQFETAETAPEGTQVSGTVRVFAAAGATAGATTGNRPATGATGDPQTGATGQTDMSATTTNQGNGFRVEVSLNGLEQGEHAWHIHSGPCGEQAPVVVAFTPTPEMEGLGSALNADQSGRAQGDATVPADRMTLDQLQNGQFSLHVHTQGGVDHGPTVACADLGQGATSSM